MGEKKIFLLLGFSIKNIKKIKYNKKFSKFYIFKNFLIFKHIFLYFFSKFSFLLFYFPLYFLYLLLLGSKQSLISLQPSTVHIDRDP